MITESVEQQNEMYFTHTRIGKAVAAVGAAQFPEDAADPAVNIYLTMAEGDVRRSARAVLALLGEQLPDNATLYPLRTRLGVHADNPACAVLLACIDTHLRNAIAHSKIEWDAEYQRVLLNGRAITPQELVRLNLQAHSTCTGLHAGISVVLNQAGNPHHHRPPPTDPSIWDGRLLEILGLQGVEATHSRRVGRTIHIRIPPMGVGTLRDHLLGVYHADQVVPHVELPLITRGGCYLAAVGAAAGLRGITRKGYIPFAGTLLRPSSRRRSIGRPPTPAQQSEAN